MANIIKGFYIAIAAAAVIMLTASPVPAGSRKYDITGYKINVGILPDGSAEIEEFITYKFDGQFEGVFLDIDFSGSRGLVGHSVEVRKFEGFKKFANDFSGSDGTYKYTVEGNIAKFVVYEHSAYAEKTFIYRYTLLDAITKYNDIAEFNRKMVGMNWEIPLKNIKIVVELPKGASRKTVKIFSHGPLIGESKFIDDNKSEFSVPVVKPGEFFETRILFPIDLVPLCGNLINKDALNEIMDFEARLAAEANEKREQARKETKRKEFLKAAGKIYALLVFVLWAILMTRIKKKYGTDPETSFNGKYYRDIPGNYPPAELNYLMCGTAAGTREILASLLDLVRRRVIQLNTAEKIVRKGLLKKYKKEYIFLKDPSSRDVSLKPHEELLIFWFFNRMGSGGRFCFSDIEIFLKDQKNIKVFMDYFAKWKRQVSEEAAKNRFYAIKDKKAARKYYIAGLCLIAGGIISGVYLYHMAALTALAGMIIILFNSRQNARTEYGSDQYRKWKAFKRFIKDFSRIKDATIPSVAVWEKYLVYSIPLGIAKEVAKHFPNIDGAEKARLETNSAIAYGIINTDKGFDEFKSVSHAFNDINTCFNSVVDVAVSSNSSSSGEGGGSSGGSSGGGGGGSGGGAF